MYARSLEKEAHACRELAKKFAGRPEQSFLFSLANALEEVAGIEAQQLHGHDEQHPLPPGENVALGGCSGSLESGQHNLETDLIREVAVVPAFRGGTGRSVV